MASIIINNIGNSILPNKTAENIPLDNIEYDKRIIIFKFKDISKKEIDTLKEYGVVLDFSNDFIKSIELVPLFFSESTKSNIFTLFNRDKSPATDSADLVKSSPA